MGRFVAVLSAATLLWTAGGQAQTAVATAADVIPFVEGEPASLWWDSAASTLFIADNENNQVWSWTDADGLRKVATTPDSSGSERAASVGQIVRLADGRLVVMRFGRPGGGSGGTGPSSGIVTVDPATGRGTEVPNVDPGHRRLGLAVTADGQLFGSYFGSAPGGGLASTLTRVDLTKGETDYASGFVKIVGVVASGDTLYVSDQIADTIYAIPARGPVPPVGQRTVFATLPRPDQLALGPDGSLFTGQFQGAPGSTEALSVRQVFPDGTVKVVASDPDVSRPSGVAYDPAGRRLFIANGGIPSQCFVRIVTVP